MGSKHTKYESENFEVLPNWLDSFTRKRDQLPDQLNILKLKLENYDLPAEDITDIIENGHHISYNDRSTSNSIDNICNEVDTLRGQMINILQIATYEDEKKQREMEFTEFMTNFESFTEKQSTIVSTNYEDTKRQIRQEISTWEKVAEGMIIFNTHGGEKGLGFQDHGDKMLAKVMASLAGTELCFKDDDAKMLAMVKALLAGTELYFKDDDAKMLAKVKAFLAGKEFCFEDDEKPVNLDVVSDAINDIFTSLKDEGKQLPPRIVLVYAQCFSHLAKNREYKYLDIHTLSSIVVPRTSSVKVLCRLNGENVLGSSSHKQLNKFGKDMSKEIAKKGLGNTGKNNK